MSYSRIKVWIAAEVLTASDLNNEHDGHITNENDLDSRLISEITTRSALETEHDAFYAACWNAGSSEIAANRVSNNSMKDDSVGFAELKSECNNPAAATPGFRSLGVIGLKACAGNDSRLSDQRTPSDTTVSQAKLKTSLGGGYVEQYSIGTTTGSIVLSGGAFSFMGLTYLSAQTEPGNNYYYGYTPGELHRNNLNPECYAYLRIYCGHSAQWARAHYISRYVTASGEIHWIFFLRDKNTKNIIAAWQAPDHPCFGNGGKPLLTPHPFGDYDKTNHEIIVINPSLEEIEQMELETLVDDETKPDKGLLTVVAENYEIDEDSNPAWPDTPITVGLPKYIKTKKGKKVLTDYRFMQNNAVVEPIKKIIPKPNYIKVKSLKRK